jgi:hypothetical protein
MLQKWREHGAITCAGYIIGFPGDTKQSILRDIEIIKRELPLDVLELFMLTPLPGSEDHKALWQQGSWMDPDLNKYDLNHRVVHHPTMPDEEWDRAYRAAWDSFYSPEHLRTILRRAAASPLDRPHTTLTTLLWFKLMTMFETVHPLEGGAFRRKSRRDRRYGLPLESTLVFYPRYAREIALKAWHYWSIYRQARVILKEVLAAPIGRPTAISRSPHPTRMNSTGSILITRLPAARVRWPTNVARTRCERVCVVQHPLVPRNDGDLGSRQINLALTDNTSEFAGVPPHEENSWPIYEGPRVRIPLPPPESLMRT